jgi:hypothetical protein
MGKTINNLHRSGQAYQTRRIANAVAGRSPAEHATTQIKAWALFALSVIFFLMAVLVVFA